MSHNVVSVHMKAPLSEVASRLADHRIGALPVLDDAARLVGIVSYVDLLDVSKFDGASRSTRRRRVARRADQLTSTTS